MLKPKSLRDHLTRLCPAIVAEPDKLAIFIEDGSIRCAGGRSLSFEYGYALVLHAYDYGDHADTLIVPILSWLKSNQPDLFDNPDRARDGFVFNAEILNHSSMDLEIKLKLTERVVVKTEPGGMRVEHVPEPSLDPFADVTRWELYIKGELVGTADSSAP